MSQIKMYELLPRGSSTKERLEAYSMPVTETGCWLWLGAERRGYGSITVGRKQLYSHRVSYEEYIGLVPEGLCVLHRCDTPLCINHEHLFLGTNGDNMQDKIKKGRGYSKITSQEVCEIVSILKSTTMIQSSIAALYDVSQTVIVDINRGRKWSRITGASKENPIRPFHLQS